LGKPPFADLREGKVTLPLLLTLKRCSSGECQEIQSLLKTLKNSADEEGGTAAPRDVEYFAPILQLVERHHGVRDTDARARQHITKAMEAIASFPEGEVKDAMLALAEYSVVRDQ
jgi:octaprenyl-diphosphate synthase